MKTQIVFLRCLTYVAMLLTFFLSVAIVPSAQSAEEHPGMFMIGPNRTLISIEANVADVHFVITDPDGLRAGYDHRTGQSYEEFQGSSGSMAERDFSWEIEFNLKDGTYSIEIIGIELTQYLMAIRLNRKSPTFEPKDISFEAVIDKDLSTLYQFTFSSDSSKPIGSAVRVATPSSLKQDIMLSKKIGWIDNDGVANSLMKKAEAIEAAMAKGNKEAARNQLNALVNEIDAQKGKHISSYADEQGYHYKGRVLVPAPREREAVKLLLDDAAYLLEQLK